ncbi:MAG: hypothetical protein K0B87_05140 [Candidatus Syntrophosphaera sp.]|nr:hypothetical protein [Candidatus Syntrophosphaera sp.]
MDKKKIIGIVVGGVALILALFFGININSGSGDPAAQLKEFVGPDGQLVTSSNLLGMMDANRNYTVYVTKSGKKYHTADCRYVLGKSISINRLEAVEEGYEPCKRCKPDGAYASTQQIPQTQPEERTPPRRDNEPIEDPYLE